MPDDYQCYACGVCFSVGWFHYHRFDAYGAATYLVCAECGVWHSVQHACDRETTPDQLCAHPGPIFRTIDPERLIILERHRVKNKHWLAKHQERKSRRKWWSKFRPTRLRINLTPPTQAMQVWRKIRPGLEMIGGILVSPVLLVLVLPILISNWYRSRHPRTLDPDRDWRMTSPPSEVVLPNMQAVSGDSASSQSTTWPSLYDTFHHLSCSHCGAEGSLTANWQTRTCPHCKQDQLESFGHWIT